MNNDFERIRQNLIARYQNAKSDLGDKKRTDLSVELSESEITRLLSLMSDISEERMEMVQVYKLLGDIVNMATTEPSKLTAFNNPLLSKACMMIYKHNNPDKEFDYDTYDIYEVLSRTLYNS